MAIFDPTILEPVGVFCTGFVVMWMGFFFVVRFKDYNIEALTGIIAILFGGVVLQFVQYADKTDFWYYPVGLLIGLIGYGLNRKYNVLPSMRLKDTRFVTMYDSEKNFDEIVQQKVDEKLRERLP